MPPLEEILILIPARGGSKRLPRKNLIDLDGKPLIDWTIEAALDANISGDIIISSEDKEILDHVSKFKKLGVKIHKRPKNLGADDSKTVDVVIDAIKSSRLCGKRYKTLILLQPTSPLRNSEDILTAQKVYDQNIKETVVSVTKTEHPSSWIGHLDNNGNLTGVDLTISRSQENDNEYRLNGAIYISDISYILKNQTLFTPVLRPLIMPTNRSIDIDTIDDYNFCCYLINRNL